MKWLMAFLFIVAMCAGILVWIKLVFRAFDRRVNKRVDGLPGGVGEEGQKGEVRDADPDR